MRNQASRLRLPALAAAATAVGLVFALPSASAAAQPVVGSAAVYANVDQNRAGDAEAFVTSAAGAGSVTSLQVYVDPRAADGALTAGLYADSSGHPGRLLAAGTIAARAPGAWNTIPLAAAAAVTTGTRYWIAILSPRGSGTLFFRDARAGTASEMSSSHVLTSLPASWSTGKTYADGALSAFGVAALDTAAPTTPSGLTVTGATTSSASVSWSASSDDTGVGGYGLYRDGAAVGTSTTTTATFAGLVCGTTYTLSVDAFDAAGNRSGQAAVAGATAACPDTQAPTQPADLTIGSVSPSSVTLSWTPSSDDVGIAGYGLYRDGAAAGTSSTTTASFGGLACGTTYAFAVDAFDQAGNRSAQAFVTGTTAACSDTQAPTAPTGLTVGAVTESSIALSWAPSWDDVGVTGYDLARDGASAGTATTTSTTFTGLSCGSSYTLTVDAFDAAGNRSAPASTVAATASCAASSGAANLWVDPSGGSCSRSASAAAYADALACSSMQAALTAAQGGDLVLIVNGTYGAQTLSTGTKSSAVTFRAQDAGRVLVSGLTLAGADRVHIYGVIASGTGDSRGSLSICDTGCTAFTTQDIVVDGFAGKSAFMRATNVTISHSEFGGFSACGSSAPEDAVRFWTGTGGDTTPRNDRFIANIVHDVDAGSGDTCQGTTHAGYHVDCMQNNGGVGITLAGNVFYNCPTSNIQWNPFAGAAFGSQTIENNWFGPTHCCNSLVLGSQAAASNCSAIVVRNNVLHKDINWTSCTTLGAVYSNVFVGGCSSAGSSYSFNVSTSGSACGSNSRQCTPAWQAPDPAWGGPRPNVHLAAADSCASRAGNPGAAPATDVDGDPRPVPAGSAPDAGPDEIP